MASRVAFTSLFASWPTTSALNWADPGPSSMKQSWQKKRMHGEQPHTLPAFIS